MVTNAVGGSERITVFPEQAANMKINGNHISLLFIVDFPFLKARLG
jgi:hypothetical protein